MLFFGHIELLTDMSWPAGAISNAGSVTTSDAQKLLASRISKAILCSLLPSVPSTDGSELQPKLNLVRQDEFVTTGTTESFGFIQFSARGQNNGKLGLIEADLTGDLVLLSNQYFPNTRMVNRN